MNQDELIEKCRLTDDEILHDCICRYRKNASADELIMSAFKGIAEYQLRKAIPIIQKAERERILNYLLAEPRAYEFETYYSIVLPKSELKALKGDSIRRPSANPSQRRRRPQAS